MLVALLLALPAPEESAPLCRPADQTPAGVMEVRCPADRAWMVSLTASYTRYEGLRDGSARVSTGDALGLGYAQVPETMDMTMVMLGLMYAPSEVLTLHASLPWLENSMRMRTNLGESFSMESSGAGDVQLGGDFVFWERDEQSISIGVSVGIPTGSITETGGMPGAPPTRLEYAMQLGSGTYDIMPRLDWRWRGDPYSYGIGVFGTVRTGHNDEDYALGDRFGATAWGAQEWSSAWSGSARVSAARWGNVRGADAMLDPLMSPTNDPALQGGSRLDGALGVNWMPFSGGLSGSVIGLELGLPLSQDLDGPQLSEEWFAALRVGLSF